METKKFFEFLLISLLSLNLSSCSGVKEEDFNRFLNETNQTRLTFRKAFRAFGDSCQTHHFYSNQILEKVLSDSIFDQYFEGGYLAYHDSLRSKMAENQDFFKVQWQNTKPVVKYYEKLDMDFDIIIERMKSGSISEESGLDSLKSVAKSMGQMITKIDSMQNLSRTNYWEFRKVYDEYEYNLNNLKTLYINKINPKEK